MPFKVLESWCEKCFVFTQVSRRFFFFFYPTLLMFCWTAVYAPLWNILDVDFIFSEKLFWPVFYLNIVLSFTKRRLFRAASGLIRGLNTHTLVGDHRVGSEQFDAGTENLNIFFSFFCAAWLYKIVQFLSVRPLSVSSPFTAALALSLLCQEANWQL